MTRVVKNEVLLFKSVVEAAPGAQSKSDPYSDILRQAHFDVKTIPVLWFYYAHLVKLQKCLRNPTNFSGIIFTSPRAVQAAEFSLESRPLPEEWKNLLVFVVGEGTASVLYEKLGLRGQGESTGNASNLADFIIAHSKKYQSPLLFPCGNLKRDILPNKLKETGIDVTPLIVYESNPHPQFEDNFKRLTMNGNQISEYVVYFSPLGVQFTLPVLQETFASCQDVKVVAIGPTTRTCLEQSQIRVWSSSLKPSPECLLQAIKNDFGPSEVNA